MNILERIEHFLNEIAFKFADSKNENYFHNSYYVFLFSPDDNYQTNGEFTHGLISHALKHLGEFNKSLESKLLGKTIQIILDSYKKEEIKIYIHEKDKGFVKELPNEKFSINDNPLHLIGNSQAGKTLINTLDAIQDKIRSGKKFLTEIERKLQNEVLNHFEEEYRKIIEKILRNAESIENKNLEEIVDIFNQRKSIEIKTNDKNTIIIYDKNNSTVVILNGNREVSTAYKVDNKDDFDDFLKKLKNYKKPLNKFVIYAIENF